MRVRAKKTFRQGGVCVTEGCVGEGCAEGGETVLVCWRKNSQYHQPDIYTSHELGPDGLPRSLVEYVT